MSTVVDYVVAIVWSGVWLFYPVYFLFSLGVVTVTTGLYYMISAQPMHPVVLASLTQDWTHAVTTRLFYMMCAHPVHPAVPASLTQDWTHAVATQLCYMMSAQPVHQPAWPLDQTHAKGFGHYLVLSQMITLASACQDWELESVFIFILNWMCTIMVACQKLIW